MASSRRKDIRGILAHPDLRRELMVSTLQATQAREGVETSQEQAERAYYVVTEGERVAFFNLEPFRAINREPERRHEMFVRSLRGEVDGIRQDVARRDFSLIEGSLLAYKSIAWLAPLFRNLSPLSPTYGVTRSGLNTTEIERFTRQRWEVLSSRIRRTWVLFAKGGSFARFYADWDLVIDWTDHGKEFKRVVAEKYGSASRFVKSERDYFRTGITWMQTTNLGINARVLPSTGIFGVASPAFFPRDEAQRDAFLAIMNSSLFDALAHCVATRNWGATAIGSIPVPRLTTSVASSLGETAKGIVLLKSNWDEGNEISKRFVSPWLLREDLIDDRKSLAARLDRIAEIEAQEESRLREVYEVLNEEIYRLYGISDSTRAIIEETLGERPPEVLWPQMEGRGVEQKRVEHVSRLLSYAVKRVVDADADGIVPFAPASGEPSLLELLHQELQTLFPQHDIGQIEVEIANELKRNVKGYRRTSGIGEWLENVFFEYHCALYKDRPILWHIASSQGTTRCAFGALCLYHKLDRNRLAKLRAQYLRDAIEGFRREAAIASKAGRTDDRIDWQARLEEAQDLDLRLQFVQEGHHEGPEGGERDYRILTPWKSEDERPKGWAPDLDDGVKVNIEPLQKAGVLRVAKVVS